mgnify:CR=1 FL=1|tara:strand:+ start:774 stop:986 length:213 start_codon:yes stop_codon:yes gene_type:complete
MGIVSFTVSEMINGRCFDLNVFQAAGNSCANVTKKRRGKTLFSFGITTNSSKKQRSSVPDPDDNSQQGTL